MIYASLGTLQNRVEATFRTMAEACDGLDAQLVIARETLLCESRAGEDGGWQEQLENIVLLTREAYAKSFTPVGVGERVVIFQTYEEPTLSTVRFCFRVIRADGEPVSCGFQTMVCMDARTQRTCPAPRLVTQYAEKENPNHRFIEFG